MADMKFNPDGSPEYRVNLNWNSGSHTFLLRGGILQHPDECAAPSQAIGFAVAQWARLETHIDALIFAINRKEYFPSDEKSPRRHPTNFGGKTDLLKKLFRHPALAHVAEEVQAISSSLTARTPNKKDSKVDVRNVLAHSILAEVTDADSSMIFHSFQVDADGNIALTINSITFESLGRFCRDIGACLLNPGAMGFEA